MSTSSATLEIHRQRFAAALGAHPFTFSHSLAGHPLLDLDVIAERADEWPARWTEHHLADLPVLLPLGDPPRRLDMGAGEVVRGLDHNGCWMVLWYLETVAAYQALLDECLDQVAETVNRREGSMGGRGANLFLGSAGSVAPAHFDRHHNMLLQIQGTKDVTIGVFDDAGIAQREIESHFGQQHNLHQLPEGQTTFHLEPGDGLYIPPYAFHWVRGGPGPSVSLSCGFRSPSSERAMLVHTCNVRLRRMGISPSPPGTSEVRDRAKAALVQGRRRLEPVRTKALKLLRTR
ncbi:MAG: hypothetical protein AVDCRST_MAG76-3386 [uncultured Acidimicrobiales bacterium]|uniref:JmjC domain-containing protein n=1 Tax=uncultured Acidimicrobiales bacterium TaxID=310071 RepID=A0A6J4J7N4_9ACTN|nr:MAG: hypothetical protein AVDCRST_MAG76-3386 [uncultured Acidimicrobiales bacterium]